MKLNDPELFRQQSYIDGQWCDADDGSVLAVTNPFDESAVGTCPSLGAVEVRRAVAAAERSGEAWRRKTGKARGEILRRWYELVKENINDLALILTTEQGKPFAEAHGEILYAASYIEWFLEEAKRSYGDVIPQTQSDKRLFVIRQPIGVCAAITSWNFPSALITRKVAPALAAGCTIVVRPPNETPHSALALAELAERAGVPAGVFNVLTGDPVIIGKELTASPVVRKLTFTGSTAVGRLLMEQSAPTVKKLSLELGGNAPFIVFDDAELDAAVEGLIQSKFRNSGQTCVCANRVFVHEAIFDDYVNKLTAKVSRLKVGSGLEKEVNQGPLINSRAVDKVDRLVQDAVAHGAKVIVGGKRHAHGGNFYEPTLLTGVTESMQLANEEIFGPVLAIAKFSSEDEVLRLANECEAGLSAYFYTESASRIWRVTEALEYGIVGANAGVVSSEVAPFGGIKQSGIGREGSKYGLDEFMELKYMCQGGF
ncbi:NAD-dependent succinate-semialdehyde dehydrogenase [Vreelandella nanhaiensis]|uniref:NAD-dependent succinate-semialdehyde dehydrogenase n=1 Tax=Vreelandella nanhaiensis TaxID=1258546 RepID=A0A3S0YYJ1_9GAMM|nr:NAD-dependent succinate-semialdehyde dehydrogenase [Halomonas nanhaiensis]RUR32668.1 NAD-dependent succinate-semialdehyde dehydrogenase [Halomonas nanhaiensis]